MATNKLLPFANGVGANVTDYDTWSALTTLLSQGFTTGVARSDYANRVFAQGALASYILGQFVVDQTAQDADLNESVFYTNFKTALLTYIKANSVTLNTTQTIGGTKTFSTTPKAPTATAGDNSTKVATTAFVKKAIDDHTDSIKPVSYGEQTLTDAEKTQARTNICAIDDTNVVHINDAQTITGKKTFTQPIVSANVICKDVDTSSLQIRGGTTEATGAYLGLVGSSRGNRPGTFRLGTGVVNGVSTYLEGNPDGSLTWAGNPILDSTSGVTLDTAQTITGAKSFGSLVLDSSGGVLRKDSATSVLRIRGGTSNANGAYLGLNGSSRSADAGVFDFTTGQTTDYPTAITLRGAPDGSLTWDSKEIERVSESGTGYIKYESGLMLCFGGAKITAGNTTVQVTYPQPFVNSYSLATTMNSMLAHGSSSQSTTGFTEQIANTSSNDITVRYVAIGTWK
jgi:hypothetical protein